MSILKYTDLEKQVRERTGGAAFPSYLGNRENWDLGMTLRDYFAAQALAGILAGGFADTIPHDAPSGGAEAAQFAYQYADAMLKERSR